MLVDASFLVHFRSMAESRVDEQFGTEVLDENYPKVSEFRALDIDLRYRYFRNEYSIDDA